MGKGIRKRIFEIVEIATPGDLPSRVFDIFIFSLIAANVVAVILETVESLSARYSSYFYSFEVLSVVVFTVEYILRLWSCTIDQKFSVPISGRLRFALTRLALIDLLAILPFYLPMVIPFDLRFVRAIRLFRVFRVFKIGRYSDSVRLFGRVFSSKKEELVMSVFVITVLLVIASGLMYFVENETQPGAFSSIPAALWWGVATLTTVGYGDIYPITTGGKILGAVIAILGIGMFALPTGILGSGFVEEIQNRRDARNICPHCGMDVRELSGSSSAHETTVRDQTEE